uniref:Variable large protein n=1 Tax=Ditylenchus dipsaci TaxID=166011 RepID=A0A915EC38_9BILA
MGDRLALYVANEAIKLAAEAKTSAEKAANFGIDEKEKEAATKAKADTSKTAEVHVSSFTLIVFLPVQPVCPVSSLVLFQLS